jgi:hypothetical protein
LLGGSCSTDGGKEKCITVTARKLEGKRRDIGADGKIVVRRNLKRNGI